MGIVPLPKEVRLPPNPFREPLILHRVLPRGLELKPQLLNQVETLGTVIGGWIWEHGGLSAQLDTHAIGVWITPSLPRTTIQTG